MEDTARTTPYARTGNRLIATDKLPILSAEIQRLRCRPRQYTLRSRCMVGYERQQLLHAERRMPRGYGAAYSEVPSFPLIARSA